MRAERGRGADPAEQGAHRAVPQHAHVIDAVRARRHARDQGRDLQARVLPHSPPGGRAPRQDRRQPRAPREGHHRDQAGVRHEMRVIERRAGLRQSMQQSHLRGVFPNRVMEC